MTDLNNDQTSMSDFIFGTLATDELRVQQIITARSGLAHEQRNLPRDPQPGTSVQIELTAGPNAPITAAFVHVTDDGSQPDPDNPQTIILPMSKSATRWDTLLWSYIDTYTAELPPQFDGTTVRYQLSGMTADGQRLWVRGNHGERETFSYNVDTRHVPAWVYDAVIYHIFMDRFAADPGSQLIDNADLGAFFGGTLKGVLSKLDYLSDLGINTLWLSPIFPSPSHHGYDATNFQEVNPRLGTKADLRALIDALHQRGMRIILDFIPNHTSDEHTFFQSARADQASPYASYYTFAQWPDDYHTFFGVKTLPQINNESPAARRYVIDSACYWLADFAVDGLRLDYAYGPSHDFWTDFYTAVKDANPDSYHFGEIVETPALLRSYEGVMDGALDFLWLQAARKLFAYGSSDVGQFEQFLSRHEKFFAGANFSLPTFLDNHDINRFLWTARGDLRRLKQAAVCQFTLSAPPIIYYGTEVGVNQRHDTRQIGLEASRNPMIWDTTHQNHDLLAFYQHLIKFRQQSTAIKTGSRTPLLVEPATGRYGYLRADDSQKVCVLFNVSATAQSFDLPDGTWRDAFTDATHISTITLDPHDTFLASQ